MASVPAFHRLAAAGLPALALALVAGCASWPPPPKQKTPPPAPPPGPTVQEQFTRASAEMFDGYMARWPTFAITLGLHQHDGTLPDLSAAGIAATVEWTRGQIAAFEALDPAQLDDTSRVEREMILAQLRGDLFDLEVARWPFRDPRFYLWFLDLSDFVTRDYAPLADRARAIVSICKAAQGHLETAQANLPAAMPRPWLDSALDQVRGMMQFVGEDVASATAALEDPALLTEVSESLLACGTALAGYRDYLQARLAEANDEFAIGADAFLRMLADKEGLEIDLTRLTDIGKRALDRDLGNLSIAARKLHPRRPIPRIIERARRDRPRPDQLIAEATRQTAAMRQFLADKDLVSVPSEDVAEVRVTPPFLRYNFAFLSAPGPFESRELPAFYYITPPDPRWPRKEQREYIPARQDLLFTTIHEVWPGHFLHHLHGKKNSSRVLRAFCSYATAEGWAHYTEQMMLEEGVGGDDPKVAVGQLLNALMRDARFLSAIGLHTGNMTVEQSMALFMEKAYQDKATARQQAIRGTFDPGYLNYTLGKLMILKLRDDWKAKMGEAYSLKAFHDSFLSYGCAPVPVIRRAMLGPDAGPAL